MKIDKNKILIIGDAGVNTGFSRVIQSIFLRVCDRYELHQLATHYSGEPHSGKWKLYPAKSEADPYGYALIPGMIKSLQPDIVFIIYDLIYQVEYLKVLNSCKGHFKVAIYSPLESGPIAPEIGMGLKGVSAFAVYTDYALGEMKDCITKIRADDPQFPFPDIKVIPHAVDTQLFYPIAPAAGETRQVTARKILFDGDEELVDSFLFLNANRNQPRKAIDISMEAFAIFAKDKPANVRLFMHMAVQDRGWNIPIMAKRLGIYERLVMMSLDNTIPAADEETLNLIYNSCDVGFTTSTGEGWGLVSFEHAATGAAQIVPAHTALKEIWTGSAEMVEPSFRLTYPGNLTHAWIVKPEDVAQAMENLYRDAVYRQQVADKCYTVSQNEAYDWDRITERWDEVFRELLL